MTGFVHRQNLRIAWSQCDPAGIVFYPQYLILFDGATGELFRTTGLGPRAMREKYGIVGLPLVEQSTRFLIPCRFDDAVVLESTIEEWGRSSFKVRHRILKDGVLAVDGWEKRVWASADPAQAGKIRAERIPPEIVASLSDASGATRCV